MCYYLKMRKTWTNYVRFTNIALGAYKIHTYKGPSDISTVFDRPNIYASSEKKLALINRTTTRVLPLKQLDYPIL